MHGEVGFKRKVGILRLVGLDVSTHGFYCATKVTVLDTRHRGGGNADWGK
jgi:hypothetical protein